MTSKYLAPTALPDLTKLAFPPLPEFDSSLPVMLSRIGLHSSNGIEIRSESESSGLMLWQGEKTDQPADAAPNSNSTNFKGTHPQLNRTDHGGALWWNLKEFFFSPMTRVEIHSGTELGARSVQLELDVRQLGRLAPEDLGSSPITIYNCRAEESSMRLQLSLDREQFRDRILSSQLGGDRTARLSNITPLHLFPREGYGNADVGAIVAMREDPLSIEIQPYWSMEALEIGMNNLQKIGIDLIDTNAIAMCELRGYGVREFKRASAILTLLFEEACRHSAIETPNETPSGLCAISVTKVTNNIYNCEMVTLNMQINDQPKAPAHPLGEGLGSNRHHRLYQIEVVRDHYGFLTLRTLDAKRSELFNLVWHDNIAPLIDTEAEIFAGLENLELYYPNGENDSE